jgi:hypothetical protein
VTQQQDQQMNDIPRTPQEVRRQKNGPIPMNAVFLALGLGAVLLLYYGPVWWEIIFGK